MGYVFNVLGLSLFFAHPLVLGPSVPLVTSFHVKDPGLDGSVVPEEGLFEESVKN